MSEEQPAASEDLSAKVVASSTGYEFTPDENSEIKQLSSSFWLLGWLLCLQLAQQVVGTVIASLLLVIGDTGTSWVSVGERLGLVVFLFPLAYWFFSASASFTAITKNPGHIYHPLTGMRAIQSSVTWGFVLLLAGLLLGNAFKIVNLARRFL